MLPTEIETKFQTKPLYTLTALCIADFSQRFHVIGGNMFLCVTQDFLKIFFLLTLKAGSLLKLVHAACLVMNSLRLLT